jgi:hypothetical protein
MRNHKNVDGVGLRAQERSRRHRAVDADGQWEAVRRFVTACLRLVMVAAVASSTIAILLGRFIALPEAGGGPARSKESDLPSYVFVRPHLLTDGESTAYLLDNETGQLDPWIDASGEILTHASFSPWRDERGQRHLAGCRMEPSTGQYFLTRETFPAGEILDRIPATVALAGPPTWYPTASARVLFAGWDGMLYQFDFEESGSVRSGINSRPKPLAWRRDPLSEGHIMIADPAWLTTTEQGGRILVSMRIGKRVGSSVMLLPARIWWLELDATGSEIVAAGPLETVAGESLEASPGADERYPVVTIGPDHSRVVAYLVRQPSEVGYALRIAPLHIDARSGHPSMDPCGRVLVKGCIDFPPAFSLDGRSVSCLVLPMGARAAVWRGDASLNSPSLSRGSSIPGRRHTVLLTPWSMNRSSRLRSGPS